MGHSKFNENHERDLHLKNSHMSYLVMVLAGCADVMGWRRLRVFSAWAVYIPDTSQLVCDITVGSCGS